MKLGGTDRTARDQLECEGGGHRRHGVLWRFIVRGFGVIDWRRGRVSHCAVVEGVSEGYQ